MFGLQILNCDGTIYLVIIYEKSRVTKKKGKAWDNDRK